MANQEVDGEHLLLALLEQPEGLVPRLLARMEAPTEALKAEVERELSRRPKVSGPGAEAGKIYLTQRLQQIFLRAEDEAKRLKDEYVSVEHLLLAMIEEGSSSPRRQSAGELQHHPQRLPRRADGGARQPAGHQRHAGGRL